MKNNSWEILKKDDGTFAILHNRELLRNSIPDRWLEAELGRYGFCGQEYKEIRRQLESRGKAEVAL
jgi:hypothetical protein